MVQGGTSYDGTSVQNRSLNFVIMFENPQCHGESDIEK